MAFRLGELASAPEPLGAALRACKRHFTSAFLFSALVNVLYLAPTLYMLQVYDRVMATGGIMTLIFITVVIVLALGTLAMLDGMRQRLLVRAGLRLDRLLAGEVLGRLISRVKPGAGAPRVGQAMREFDNFRATVAGQGIMSLFDAPWTPIYLAFAFILHPLLGLVTLFGGAVLLTLAILNERTVKPRLQKAGEAAAAAYMAQETAANSAEVVKALGMRNALVARQLTDRTKATELQAEAAFAGGKYTGAIKFVRLTLQSLSLGLGAYLAIERQISAGAVIAASVLLSRALQPLEQVVGAWQGIVNGRQAFNTLVDLFTQYPPEGQRTQLPAPKGLVQVEQIGVRMGETLVLKGVSMSIQPGEVVGLIGPSGAGKTTLARVVAGAVQPDYGAVRLDGADLKDWESDKLAKYVGYLPQDSILFHGSIRDNISRFQAFTGGDPAEIDARVVAAAQAAGAHEMILRLPKGYDSMLGVGGRGLSSGQSQRIAFARAIYGEPAMIVLDEPNAHLDAEGEGALMRTLMGLKERGAAVLLVAHRTGILNAADKLLVLREGAVEMFGPRDDVVARLQQQEKGARPGPRPTVVAGG
jgi:ATP-binding cassette subfamily C protein